ncbi:hypothetical protein [Phaeocystidibacter marisrubri]|uniref:Uncharacterized protein n=1 Tax=Phaeocystidibacter marisrubri TaxID=1577780 RepID=A0A6L3ZFC1_9FLAO|nr:hypothetical protein [Phaeocystidibacter marisrubri]KAB2815589.1 hypothetical protein F8C82_07755 [Phaeocystidibacter marisrubri]GGH64675.1 hypothetical protein GCM10011318_00930 [Phaeocystidibacter marisrubri]
MGFGQSKHNIEIGISASSLGAAKSKAVALERIGNKANEESLQILAELAQKPNINSLLKKYSGMLKSL